MNTLDDLSDTGSVEFKSLYMPAHQPYVAYICMRACVFVLPLEILLQLISPG